MTVAKARNNRKSAIAQIHIARNDLAMDEDTYRQMIATVTRGKARSCRDCSLGDLYSILARMQQLGWKNNRRKYSPKAQGKIVDVIRAVWINMHQDGIVGDGSEAALSAWVERQTSRMNGGQGVVAVEWLERDPKMAAQVLESLKKWYKRVLRERGEL